MSLWSVGSRAALAASWLSLAPAAQDRAPTWQPGPAVQAGPMAGLPEIGDVDGDGHLDVVVACGPCCAAYAACRTKPFR